MSKLEQYGDVTCTPDENYAKHELIRDVYNRIDFVFDEYKLDKKDFHFEYFHYEEYYIKGVPTPVKEGADLVLYCIAWKGTRKIVQEDMLSNAGEYEAFLMNMKG